MGRNGESGAFGLAAARGGEPAAGVGARFARLALERIKIRSGGDKTRRFENRRRVHTRKCHPPRVFGLIRALSIAKSGCVYTSRSRLGAVAQREVLNNKPY